MAEVRVAFVGNSYVYFNDLPGTLSQMLARCDPPVKLLHKQVAPGGQTLKGHADDENVSKMLARGPWDFVFLQDNSNIPGGANGGKDLLESLTALDTVIAPLIKQSGAKVILVATPGHRDGSIYPAQRVDYPDFVTMSRKTLEGVLSYGDVLKKHGIPFELLPVGTLFYEAFASEREPLNPNSLFYRLYYPDAFHPSNLGTFFMAAALCQLLTPTANILDNPYVPDAHTTETAKKFHAKLPDRYGSSFVLESVTKDDANILRQLVRKVYLDRASSHRIFGIESSHL